jgi:hypothetical protein
MNIKVEKYEWGYFLEDAKKAVAVVGSWADAVRVLKRWRIGH